jgi:sodium-dependent dicarboxylate transporter 2/3/5
MLVTAYAASIGGIATPVGTPPNLIAVGLLDKLAGVRIPFFQWMLVATPVMVAMLVFLLGYMRWALPPEMDRIEGSDTYIKAEQERLGPWSTAQRNVLLAFGCTVALWVLPGVLAIVVGTDAPLYKTVHRHLPEAVVAVVGAALLFVLPVNWTSRRFTLSWSDAARVDWGTLLLFGGGLSLGGAMFRTGLAKAVGRGLVDLTGARSPMALAYLFSTASIVLTETTSNTAAMTMIGPLAIAAAKAAGHSPVPMAMACSLVASLAFLLPVSTPPNAIVYGSGCVPITAMLKHGGLLDLMGLALTPGAVVGLCRVLGL